MRVGYRVERHTEWDLYLSQHDFNRLAGDCGQYQCPLWIECAPGEELFFHCWSKLDEPVYMQGAPRLGLRGYWTQYARVRCSTVHIVAEVSLGDDIWEEVGTQVVNIGKLCPDKATYLSNAKCTFYCGTSFLEAFDLAEHVISALRLGRLGRLALGA